MNDSLESLNEKTLRKPSTERDADAIIDLMIESLKKYGGNPAQLMKDDPRYDLSIDRSLKALRLMDQIKLGGHHEDY